MSNCAIIILEGESALTHPPLRRNTFTHPPLHGPTHMYTHPPPRMHMLTHPHPQYCAAGSTSVIHKMTIPWRQSPFMDDLVRSNPLPLHQDWLKDLFDVCVWKHVGLV
ncbi:hypothetical protein O181_088222 [Austropuccinia psidii MF-1]|uniref:Uncharacterized protein n=1 Tax=Austropuccinia psidii MF-1 TaxID=1389203 RepID=A0A9Q3IR77_9BASI|nr:hypothetical protein [Austropuccinia psidii MF-1]